MTGTDRDAATFPAVATHNYDPALLPFRNLCDQSDAAAERILERFRLAGRRLGSRHMARRRHVESWLIAERRRLLGETRLRRPLYLFLDDYADGLDLARPASLRLPLDALPAEALTLTWGDSSTIAPHDPEGLRHRRTVRSTVGSSPWKR